MDEMAIRAFVLSRRGEGEDFELKKGVAGIPSAVETLTAFANDFLGLGKEGWVVFGVDTGKDDHGFEAPLIVGLSAAEFKEIEGKVLALCRDKVEPGLLPRVFQESLEDGRRLLAFQVAASRQVHFFSNGKRACYVRAGSHTSEARGGLYAELLRRKGLAPPYLDEPCPTATMADLDLRSAERFFRGVDLPRALATYFEPDQPIDANTRPLVVLSRDGVPVPTFLALLLFGHEPTRFLRGAWAIFGVYTGKTRSAERSFKVELANRPLPELIEKLKNELQPHLPIDIDKSYDPSSGEQNRWIYSSKALHEAIINAFAHRDYTSAEPTRITVFEDRIEIWNPGGAPPGVDRRALEHGEAPPLWRNPSLAAFLVRLKLAQREGQGLRTILEEAERMGTAPPEILSTAADFTVKLPAYRRPARKQPRVGAGSTDGIILISIGGPSLGPQFEYQRQELGLEGAQILVDLTRPGYVEGPGSWEAVAERIRDEIRPHLDDPKILRFHLFYRGPGVLATVVGAMIAPSRPLWLYYYTEESGRYRLAYVLDQSSSSR